MIINELLFLTNQNVIISFVKLILQTNIKQTSSSSDKHQTKLNSAILQKQEK